MYVVKTSQHHCWTSSQPANQVVNQPIAPKNGIEWENLLFWNRDEKGLANSHLLQLTHWMFRMVRQHRRRWYLPLQSDTFSSNSKWVHINFPRYGFLFSIFQQIVPQKTYTYTRTNRNINKMWEKQKNIWASPKRAKPFTEIIAVTLNVCMSVVVVVCVFFFSFYVR